MVGRIARLVAAALLVLPLCACIFVLSPFPATLSQVVARTDVSATIPAAYGLFYRPYVVTPTGGELVILMSNNNGIDPVAIVMDSNLNVIQSYTGAWLTSQSYDTSGTGVMTNAEGSVEISNLGFSAAELATPGATPSWVNPTLGGIGFGSPTAQKEEINFNAGSGNSLVYVQWTWFYTVNDFIGSVAVINPSGGNYNVEAVYDADDTPSAGNVILVLGQANNSSNVTFVAVPLADVLTNAIASPLLSNYPNKSYANIDSRSIGFAGDSIVAYSYDSSSLNRYSLSGFDVISSLPIGKTNNDLQYAYKMSGGYSVVYNATTRVLTKVANWW